MKLYDQIVDKKEFSKLLKKDVEMAFNHFKKREVSDTEKIRLTRELLHKVFSSFTSRKLLSPKSNKDPEWILRKHLSTRERLPHYNELYGKLKLKGNVIDLGAGINGFSYGFMSDVDYIGVEAVGQLVDLTNAYFKNNKFSGVVVHLSLFELNKIKNLIKKIKKPKTIFLFKTLDSLEMLERDYSKKLLEEITPLVDRIIVSFATRSMISRKKFNVSRNWIRDFIDERFKITDDFELGSERYIVFRKK